MYKVHQNAKYIPAEIVTAEMRAAEGVCAQVPQVSVTASVNESGMMHISLVNTSPEKAEKVRLNIGKGMVLSAGEILTANEITAHNTFEKPDMVETIKFEDMKQKGSVVEVTLPALSIVTIEMNQTKKYGMKK